MNILKKRTTQILLAVIVVLLIIFLGIVFSQRGEKVAPPGFGLFISWSDGDIYVSDDGESWDKADIKTLLTNGYRVRTGKDSKAILQTPQGSTIRMDENTEVKVAQLSRRDVLLVQNAGRTYHRVKMSVEGAYQVRALNHTIKSVSTAFDVAVNRKANRINAKVLEGKLNVAINLEDVIEVQSIGKNKEITVDPNNTENFIALSDVSGSYMESDWFNWNKEEDMKIGFVVGVQDDSETRDPETSSGTTKTQTTPASATTPARTSTGTCQPYLTAKKSATYKGILLNWSTCSNGDFQFYKVIRSTLNSNPSFPNDPVITSSSNRNYSNFIDKTVIKTRTYHYRVCVVQRLDKVSCGNKVSVTY